MARRTNVVRLIDRKLARCMGCRTPLRAWPPHREVICEECLEAFAEWWRRHREESDLPDDLPPAA